MELVTPGIGLIFWMTVSFVTLLLILRKFAWKPVLRMLKNREESIAEALEKAEQAREETLVLEQQNKEFVKKNNEKYLAMINEIEKVRRQKLEETREEAHIKSEQLMREAKERIESEKQLAYADLKKDMADISVEIASKILREQLKSEQKVTEFAQMLVDEMELN